MRELIWKNHRLSWPVVLTVALLTLSIVGFDFSWRVLVVPFQDLVMAVVISDALAFGALVATARALGRAKRRPGSSVPMRESSQG